MRGTLVERVDQSFLKSFKAIQRIDAELMNWLMNRLVAGEISRGKSAWVTVNGFYFFLISGRRFQFRGFRLFPGFSDGDSPFRLQASRFEDLA